MNIYGFVLHPILLIMNGEILFFYFIFYVLMVMGTQRVRVDYDDDNPLWIRNLYKRENVVQESRVLLCVLVCFFWENCNELHPKHIRTIKYANAPICPFHNYMKIGKRRKGESKLLIYALSCHIKYPQATCATNLCTFSSDKSSFRITKPLY